MMILVNVYVKQTNLRNRMYLFKRITEESNILVMKNK